MKVYYNSKQNADSKSFSPSASKPAKVIQAWQEMGLPIEIIRSGPVDEIDLCLAHSPEYVHGVLRCTESNGFGNRSPAIAASLPYTSGSLYAAAKGALKHRTATCSPTSGFHHAGYHHGSGFCTFNGLMVVAQKLKKEGVDKIGVLDCDFHFGNGTEDIIDHLKLDFVPHFTGGARYHSPKDAPIFLKCLESIIRQTFAGCDVVLFQAGADVALGDPLGGYLTTEQIAVRDRIVFETLHDMGIPVAWNFAGGYQVEKDGSIPRVIEIHTNTLLECIKVHSKGKAVA